VTPPYTIQYGSAIFARFAKWFTYSIRNVLVTTMHASDGIFRSHCSSYITFSSRVMYIGQSCILYLSLSLSLSHVNHLIIMITHLNSFTAQGVHQMAAISVLYVDSESIERLCVLHSLVGHPRLSTAPDRSATDTDTKMEQACAL
jgi:hypothetical protein